MAAKEPMSGTADPVVDAYKAGIDRTLFRENLRRSPTERLLALQQLQAFAEELRRAEKDFPHCLCCSKHSATLSSVEGSDPIDGS